MAHEIFKPQPVHDTKQYGFVINHDAYWGIPIPGYDRRPQPHTVGPTDPTAVPREVRFTNIHLHTHSGWTAGEFKLLSTRTPPLFHAFHHKTDENLPAHTAFELRSERNVIESNQFGDRVPLPGNGQRACVEISKLEHSGHEAGTWLANPTSKTVPFSDFDTGNHEAGLIKAAIEERYFETRRGTWDVTCVGPLNALWLVLLQKDANNTPLDRLGGGYRLWHHLNLHMGEETTDGHRWKIEHEDYRRFWFSIELSGQLNSHSKGHRCPGESIELNFQLEWA